MVRVSKEVGVYAVLAKRMVEERLPKALALKDRVNRGERLNDFDLAFLEQVVKDARHVLPMVKEKSEGGSAAAHMLNLYNEIMAKGLLNEQAGKKLP